MADGFIGLPGDSTGKKLDATELVVGANTVERERMVIAGDVASALAPVTSSAGLTVNVTSGQLTALSTGPYVVVSASSGAVQVLTSGPLITVAASSGITQAIIIGTSGTAAVSTDSAVIEQPNGVVDPNNSSTTPLAGNATFTGTATNILLWARVVVSIMTDQASAANGAQFQFSQDGINWDHVTSYTQPADEITTALTARLKFFRIVYTNGAVAQGTFRLQTTLRSTPPAGTVRELSVVPNAGDMAQLTRSVISGTTGGSVFTDVKVNPSGTLQIGGTISISSGTITLSSAPLVVLASSGPATLVTLSSTPLVLVATSGASMPPTALSSGTVTLSSAPLVLVATSGASLPPTALSSGTVTVTSGTITLSSNPTVITASSGAVQALLSSASFAPVTSSQGLLVNQTHTIAGNVFSSIGAPLIANVSTRPVTLFSVSVATTGAASHVLNLYNTATCGLSSVASTYMRWAVLSTPGTQLLFQSALGMTASVGLQVTLGLTMTSVTVSTAATTVQAYTNVEYQV